MRQTERGMHTFPGETITFIMCWACCPGSSILISWGIEKIYSRVFHRLKYEATSPASSVGPEAAQGGKTEYGNRVMPKGAQRKEKSKRIS